MAALYLAATSVFAQTLIRSGPSQSQMIELYTSEGCSSCPPADEWVSTLTTHPDLWEQIVPVVFHVDYWDYIGWVDRFAQPEFAQRQRQMAIENGQTTVYTPGLLANGEEWRNFSWASPEASEGDAVGVLVGRMHGNSIDLQFDPAASISTRKLVGNVALLGFELVTEVHAGENRGRELHHDFVVLGHEQRSMDRSDGIFRTTVKQPHSDVSANRYALAIWVSSEDGLAPLQAAGGWLD